MASSGLRAFGRVGWLVFVCAGLLASGLPAWAQSPMGAGGFQGFTGAPDIGGNQRESVVRGAGAPPPAALPGAQSKPETAAPAAQPSALMDPTEALFDAINRGDIAAARDAVNRGADLGGHNLLGMTPIQLSVDLARNDITFLLLSAGGAGASAPVTRTAGAPAKPSRHAERQSPRPVQRVVVTKSPPQQNPHLFAGNGGSPIPQAGFLGFDPGR